MHPGLGSPRGLALERRSPAPQCMPATPAPARAELAHNRAQGGAPPFPRPETPHVPWFLQLQTVFCSKIIQVLSRTRDSMVIQSQNLTWWTLSCQWGDSEGRRREGRDIKNGGGGIKRKSYVSFSAETAKFGFTVRSRHPREGTSLALVFR